MALNFYVVVNLYNVDENEQKKTIIQLKVVNFNYFKCFVQIL